MNSGAFLFSDVAVYLGLPLSLWISFRIIGYPDLALEQLFVLGGVVYACGLANGWSILAIFKSRYTR